MGKEFRFSMERDRTIVGAFQLPRAGWDESFRLMAERGDDQLFDEESVNQSCWDDAEWEW
jgi:hypothetical protein